MRLIAFCISLLLFVSICAANIPSWVQPGVIVTYQSMATNVDALGNYNNPGSTFAKMQVIGREGNSVQIDTTFGTLPSKSTSFCTEGQPCDWIFWVDPNDPLNSVVGTNGERFQILGETPYSDAEGRKYDTVLLSLNLPGQVDNRIYYEKESGLIIGLILNYPNKLTSMTLKSIEFPNTTSTQK
ncbi:MAG: hypothetical protein ACYDHX_16220 [Methanothrix sp.]